MLRIAGFTIATALTTTALAGIGALIMNDFPEVRETLGSLIAAMSTTPDTKWPDDVDDINLFFKTPIEGTDLFVTTGVAFSSPENLSQSRASSYWCYVNYNADIVSNRLDLGSRQGDAPPVYTTGAQIPDAAVRDIGIDRYKLSGIAMSHCKFHNLAHAR